MRYVLVDFEFGVGFKVFPHGGFWVVAGTPGAVGEHVLGHILNQGIHNHTVATDAGERGIGFQFSQYMLVGMITVETDQDTRKILGDVPYLLDDVRGDA